MTFSSRYLVDEGYDVFLGIQKIGCFFNLVRKWWWIWLFMRKFWRYRKCYWWRWHRTGLRLILSHSNLILNWLLLGWLILRPLYDDSNSVFCECCSVFESSVRWPISHINRSGNKMMNILADLGCGVWISSNLFNFMGLLCILFSCEPHCQIFFYFKNIVFFIFMF